MRAAGAETQRLPVRNWPQTHFHFQSMCISPQIHPQNVNVFDAYFLITVRVGRANSLVELPCWSSNGVPAWPVGHPREYQHDLLVVPAQRASTYASSCSHVPRLFQRTLFNLFQRTLPRLFQRTLFNIQPNNARHRLQPFTRAIRLW